ncbi:hypothetical protein NDU88_002422 [Pleurodeles waltl]|uniref:Uncharacterized protein n=1 Tax=Pleurodeles waltl TaxID=8319 RepID=A0AAV7QCU9_PLEWA|nr:hypothetical protein NDU88_002422 [Pleurodeles waltl]
MMSGSHAAPLHPAAAAGPVPLFCPASGQGSSPGYGLPGVPLLLESTFRQPHTALASPCLINQAGKRLTPLPHVGLFSNVSTQGGPHRPSPPMLQQRFSRASPSLRRFGKRGASKCAPGSSFNGVEAEERPGERRPRHCRIARDQRSPCGHHFPAAPAAARVGSRPRIPQGLSSPQAPLAGPWAIQGTQAIPQCPPAACSGAQTGHRRQISSRTLLLGGHLSHAPGRLILEQNGFIKTASHLKLALF